MRQICTFLLFLMLCSCEYFNVKKVSSESILEEELQTFNWNDVDEYPTFSEQTLSGFITGYLQKDAIIVTQDIYDTISLNFKVTDKGDLILLDTKMDSLTHNEIPNINQLLAESLNSLPTIFPAIKRGQHVTTEFTLPIIINAN
jgi:hypothetical protein